MTAQDILTAFTNKSGIGYIKLHTRMKDSWDDAVPYCFCENPSLIFGFGEYPNKKNGTHFVIYYDYWAKGFYIKNFFVDLDTRLIKMGKADKLSEFVGEDV